MTPAVLQAIFDRALEEEIGVVVPVEEGTTTNVMNRLYDFRKASGNPEYEKVMIFLPKGVNEVWLVKKATEMPE